jgi:phosphatidylglycerophosphatase A
MNASGQPGDGPSHRPVGFLTRCIATGFFAGYFPWASGTIGTLVGLGISLIPGVHTPPVLLPLTIVGFSIGVYVAGKVAEAEGDRLSRSAAAAKAVFQPGERTHPDPSIVVVDEIIGIWITLLWLPPSASAYVLAFVAFRAYDVMKPVPVRSLEHIPGGWGIMLDDVVAGLYANITVRLILLLLSSIPGMTFVQ